jgi:hypothetical protein
MYKDFAKAWYDRYGKNISSISFYNEDMKISIISNSAYNKAGYSEQKYLLFQTNKHIFFYDDEKILIPSDPFITGIWSGSRIQDPTKYICSFNINDFCEFDEQLKIKSVNVDAINNFIDTLIIFK